MKKILSIFLFGMICMFANGAFAGPNEDLFDAIYGGNLSTAKSAISSGADVNAINRDGWTALTYASGKSREDIVNLLLSKGADINASGSVGITPLAIVSFVGNKDMVKLLLSKGADVNVKTDSHGTALDQAESRGEKEIVKILKQAGAKETSANTYIPDAYLGQNKPLTEAEKKIMDGPLTKNIESSAKAKELNEKLLSAVKSNNVDAVKSAISDRAWVDMHENGKTVLDIAIENNNTEIIAILKNAGAKTSVQSQKITKAGSEIKNKPKEQPNANDYKRDEAKIGEIRARIKHADDQAAFDKLIADNKTSLDKMKNDAYYAELQKYVDTILAARSTKNKNEIEKLEAENKAANEQIAALDKKYEGQKGNVWRNEEGEFNKARLASDAIAGVTLGALGGFVTNKLIKNSQLDKGFDVIECSVDGKVVAGYGDEFRVGSKN